jgi:homoserine dehydrogenase
LGEGAGAQPTSSAIIADVIYLAQSINLGLPSYTELRLTHDKIIASISELETKYYLRLTVVDRPGVLAQITKILGDHLISIASVIQKESDKQANSAEIVIMSYPAKEKAMQQALMEMAELEVVKEISNFIRIED